MFDLAQDLLCKHTLNHCKRMSSDELDANTILRQPKSNMVVSAQQYSSA